MPLKNTPENQRNNPDAIIRQRRSQAQKTKDGLLKIFGKPKIYVKEGKVKIKVMSNADRRKLGIEQDPELPDYQNMKERR